MNIFKKFPTRTKLHRFLEEDGLLDGPNITVKDPRPWIAGDYIDVISFVGYKNDYTGEYYFLGCTSTTTTCRGFRASLWVSKHIVPFTSIATRIRESVAIDPRSGTSTIIEVRHVPERLALVAIHGPTKNVQANTQDLPCMYDLWQRVCFEPNARLTGVVFKPNELTNVRI